MCLRIALELSHIEVHPAFQWKGKNIKGLLGRVFSNIPGDYLNMCPFSGTSDILLRGRQRIGQVIVQSPADYGNDADAGAKAESVICVEVGIQKEVALSVQLKDVHCTLPSKLGQLMASMYMFATLEDANCHHWAKKWNFL